MHPRLWSLTWLRLQGSLSPCIATETWSTAEQRTRGPGTCSVVVSVCQGTQHQEQGDPRGRAFIPGEDDTFLEFFYLQRNKREPTQACSDQARACCPSYPIRREVLRSSSYAVRAYAPVSQRKGELLSSSVREVRACGQTS